MDALTALAVFLAGLLLRIGLPLGLTALAVWLLRRLDARWEAEAREAQRRSRFPAAVAPTVRCWVFNNCSAEQRAACAAYAHPQVPCWQYFRDKQGHLRERCLGCDVFRRAPALSAA